MSYAINPGSTHSVYTMSPPLSLKETSDSFTRSLTPSPRYKTNPEALLREFAGTPDKVEATFRENCPTLNPIPAQAQDLSPIPESPTSTDESDDDTIRGRLATSKPIAIPKMRRIQTQKTEDPSDTSPRPSSPGPTSYCQPDKDATLDQSLLEIFRLEFEG